METKVNYTIVGAFVLLLSGLLIAGILWLASGGGFRKTYDLYQALVDESVAGLSLSAPVKYRGVDVGKVKDIRIAPDNPELVQLIFAIERGTPVKEDTEAVLKTQGLTGIAYVELSGGSRESPPLRAKVAGAYPEIRTKPSLSARLENVLTTVLAKLDSTSDSVNKILSEENLAAFKSTLADLSVLSRTLAARKDTIDSTLASAGRTFDNSARITAQVSKDLGPLLERVAQSADAVKRMGDETAQAAASAGRTAESVGSDVKRFSADTLPELQRLLGEVNALTITLRRFIHETERNPRGFLFGRKSVPAGPGEAREESQAK
jgi:phospholipid/cholesterol/gamma-HCH transport system substrate-binding protein